MTIVQPSDFIGEVNIPKRNGPDVCEALQGFIDKYEPKFLTMLLGAGLYSDLKEGLDVPSDQPVNPKWLNLLELVKPAIVNYVYYWVRRDMVSTTSETGELLASNANSSLTNPSEKMVRAWNEMVDICWGVVRTWNVATYGRYYQTDRGYYCWNAQEIFRKINTLGI